MSSCFVLRNCVEGPEGKNAKPVDLFLYINNWKHDPPSFEMQVTDGVRAWGGKGIHLIVASIISQPISRV